MRKSGMQFKRGFQFRDSEGWYPVKARKYPAVSKVLGPYDDFLFAHIAKIQEEVGRLWALHDAGMSDRHLLWMDDAWKESSVMPETLLRDGKHIANAGLRYLKQCADRGSTIDDYLMAYCEGMDPDPDQIEGVLEMLIYGKSRACTVDQVLPYGKSLQAYLDAEKPEYVMGQMAVIDDTNRIAGTPDYWRWDSEKGFILQSVKTSSNATRFERRWMAQEAIYSHAEYAIATGESFGIEEELPTLGGVEWLVLTEETYRVRSAPMSLMDTWHSSFCVPAIKAFHAMRECPLPETAKAVRTAA